MADFPYDLDAALAAQFARAFDVEGKVPRALEALGPIAGLDVVLVDGSPALFDRVTDAGARVTAVASTDRPALDAADGAADVVVVAWSRFSAATAEEVREAQRVLRPGGRLLVVHDYGRDDVAALRDAGEWPAYGAWSRRDGPFLSGGFRIRVIHAWLTFDSITDAASFMVGAFGAAGREASAKLTRPRLSYNVAVYHRTVGGSAA
jgi:SAM-dependent methyltransferase